MLRRISSATADGTTTNGKLLQYAEGAVWNIDGPPRMLSTTTNTCGDDSVSEQQGDILDLDAEVEPQKSASAVAETEKVSKHTKSEVVKKTTTQEHHIMISYSWAHQEPVRKLNAALQELGYRTWLDKEQMSMLLCCYLTIVHLFSRRHD